MVPCGDPCDAPRVALGKVGASSVRQVKENLAALDVVPRLDSEFQERIEGILDNRPMPEKNWRG